MPEVVLCAFEELDSGQSKSFDLEGRRLLVVRIKEQVYVLDDRCSHEDFALFGGEVTVAGCEIECSRHGSGFSLETGEPNSLPATKPVKTYQVLRRDGEVVVVIP